MKLSKLIFLPLALVSVLSFAQDNTRRVIVQCEEQFPTYGIPQTDYARLSQVEQQRQQCIQQLLARFDQKPTGPAPFKDGKVTGKVVNKLPLETPSKTAPNVPQN